jgi:hypothetical protein
VEKTWQKYVESASGLTEVTRRRAEQIVRSLVKQGEIAADLLRAGKHVFMEKPVANISVNATSRAPPATAPATRSSRWRRVASRSSHTMSCCTAAILIAALPIGP